MTLMKTKTVFVCQSCGSQSARWVGKCPNCEEWNSYVEETSVPRVDSGKMRVQIAAQAAAAPVLLKEVDIDSRKAFFDRYRGIRPGHGRRYSCGFRDFDRRGSGDR